MSVKRCPEVSNGFSGQREFIGTKAQLHQPPLSGAIAAPFPSDRVWRLARTACSRSGGSLRAFRGQVIRADTNTHLFAMLAAPIALIKGKGPFKKWTGRGEICKLQAV